MPFFAFALLLKETPESVLTGPAVNKRTHYFHSSNAVLSRAHPLAPADILTMNPLGCIGRYFLDYLNTERFNVPPSKTFSFLQPTRCVFDF